MVATDLIARIVSGELSVGQVLPTENELAGAYGVGRSVIREANKLLEVHRLVQPKARRGTVVLDPLASLSAEVLQAMLLGPGGKVDCAVFADILEIRARIDVEMGVLAARRRTDADLQRLDQSLVELAAVVHDNVAYSGQVNTFALAIAHAAHNRLFEMLVHWHGRVSHQLHALLKQVRLADGGHLQGCYAIVEAIRLQDEGLVRQLVEAFHVWATPVLLGAVERMDQQEGEA